VQLFSPMTFICSLIGYESTYVNVPRILKSLSLICFDYPGHRYKVLKSPLLINARQIGCPQKMIRLQFDIQMWTRTDVAKQT
jgi:hypothetical protein